MKKEDIFHMCVQNLLRRKSRTFLTLLGVIIGCCSIVIMVSIGIGMKESQEKMLSQMGDLTIITVSPQQNGKGKVKLDDKMLSSFQAIEGVTAVTAKMSLEDYTVKLYAGSNNRYVLSDGIVVGIDSKAIEAMGYPFISGSNISRSGEVLVGQYLAYNFADSMRPEGQNIVDRWSGGYDDAGNPINLPNPYFNAGETPMTLEIENNGKKVSMPIKPKGVLKEDYAKGYETSDGIIMSLEDLRELIKSVQDTSKKSLEYKTVLVKVADITKVSEVETSLKKLGFTTFSMESIREPMEQEARQKQLMLGGLGAISLFVAALGITNTMVMSISERTREIGIMKALGCYVYDIRIMFLSEAGVIGFLGGLMGCIISVLASIVINLVSIGIDPLLPNLVGAIVGGEGISRISIIPLWLLLFAILFSIAIGLLSGYYPANKAVQISALEAIKSE